MIDPTTDPIPEEEAATPHRRSRIGWLGQLIGLDHIERLIHLSLEREARIMATLDDVNALVAQTGADAQATADRVIAAIAAATTGAAEQIAALQQQVADLIAGNASDITPEQLQAVADGLTAVDTTIKGIAPDA